MIYLQFAVANCYKLLTFKTYSAAAPSPHLHSRERSSLITIHLTHALHSLRIFMQTVNAFDVVFSSYLF